MQNKKPQKQNKTKIRGHWGEYERRVQLTVLPQSILNQTHAELQNWPAEATALASEQHTNQAKPEGVGESHSKIAQTLFPPPLPSIQQLVTRSTPHPAPDWCISRHIAL